LKTPALLFENEAFGELWRHDIRVISLADIFSNYAPVGCCFLSLLWLSACEWQTFDSFPE